MTEQDELKLCAARYAYRKNKQGCKTPKSGLSWPEWWSDKFNQDYHQFVSDASASKYGESRGTTTQ